MLHRVLISYIWIQFNLYLPSRSHSPPFLIWSMNCLCLHVEKLLCNFTLKIRNICLVGNIFYYSHTNITLSCFSCPICNYIKYRFIYVKSNFKHPGNVVKKTDEGLILIVCNYWIIKKHIVSRLLYWTVGYEHSYSSPYTVFLTIVHFRYRIKSE